MSSFLQESQMKILLSYLLTSLPLLSFLFFLYKWLTHKTGKSLPSPTKLPILGNLHQIGKYAHRSLHQLSQKHGELMLLHFGRKPVLVVSSANAAREIMKTHDVTFADRPSTKLIQIISFNFKDVALAPYGEYWRQLRSICVHQLLSNKRVQSYNKIRDEEIAQMIDDIKKSPTEVNLSEKFITFSNDMICRVALGIKCKGERYGINFKKVMDKQEELLGGFYVGDFIPWLAWVNHVNGVYTEAKKVASTTTYFVERIIEEHREVSREQRSKIQSDKDEKVKDLVDVLLDLQEDDKAGFLDKVGMKALLVDMFVAGTTTTFATLEWIMSELLRNPRVMKVLQEEVRGIIRGKDSITDDDLEKMKYLKAVIKETFRLHPPVPLLLPRLSRQEATVNGYNIPAKTEVIINTWAIHRDPSLWENPEEFYPERFLNSDIDFKGQDFELIPFGAGRRGCPGMSFAAINIELVVANIVDKFDWELPGKADGKALDMTEHPALTIHRNCPLISTATPHYA